MGAEESLVNSLQEDFDFNESNNHEILTDGITDLLNDQIQANLHRRYTSDMLLEKRATEIREILTKELFIDGATVEHLRQILFEINTIENRIKSIENGSPITVEEVKRVKWRLEQQKILSDEMNELENMQISSHGHRTTLLNEGEMQKLLSEKEDLTWKNRNLKKAIDQYLSGH